MREKGLLSSHFLALYLFQYLPRLFTIFYILFNFGICIKQLVDQDAGVQYTFKCQEKQFWHKWGIKATGFQLYHDQITEWKRTKLWTAETLGMNTVLSSHVSSMPNFLGNHCKAGLAYLVSETCISFTAVSIWKGKSLHWAHCTKYAKWPSAGINK